MSFKEVKTEELQMNPFTAIGKEWLLITAGTKEKCNTMTASWGAMGVMWGEPAVTVYLRPQRYTKEFVDREGCFTISILGEEYRKALNLCGTVSGKDRDKIKEAGLTPAYFDDVPGFEEAKLVLVCKTMYHDEIRPECFDETKWDGKWYPNKDYHMMYIAKVCKAYIRQ